MYFANAPICKNVIPFINETITKRLVEGSVELVGEVLNTNPPRCVNALSIEPKKPRLVLSIKGPNLWCKDTPFKLVPLGEIAKSINRGGTFSATDDAQGYKQVLLNERSKSFCGFEWAGFYFVDTTLPFGFKNSAYIYSSIGFVFSTWLIRTGAFTQKLGLMIVLLVNVAVRESLASKCHVVVLFTCRAQSVLRVKVHT